MTTKFTLKRTGKFKIGQFVELVWDESTSRFLPIGLYVTRVVSQRHYDRELLDDLDEFDSSPGWESEIEVEERPVDDTPRFKIGYPDPRAQFATHPGTVFRFQGQLFRDCYGDRVYPLGDDSGVRPQVGDPVEIVRREYCDYQTERTADGVIVTIDHDLYGQHDRLLCGPGRYRIVSAFFGSDFGHFERTVENSPGPKKAGGEIKPVRVLFERGVATSRAALLSVRLAQPPVLHGRACAKRQGRWVWDVQPATGSNGETINGKGHYEDHFGDDAIRHADFTLQLSEFPCPVLTLERIEDLR